MSSDPHPVVAPRTGALLILLALTLLPACAAWGRRGAVPLPDGPARLEAVIDLAEARFLRPLEEDPAWHTACDQARDALAWGAPWQPVVDGLLASLDTSHTVALTPDDLRFHHIAGIFGIAQAFPELYPDGEVAWVGAGWFLDRLDGRVFVAEVMPGTPAARAGVLRGDRLVAVDGAPWAGLPSLGDRPGVDRVLTVQRQRGGPTLDLVLRPERLRPRQMFLDALREGAALHDVDGLSIAHVRVWSYADPAAQELLTELVTSGPLAGADALVLDLRGGWGGAQPAYLDLFHRAVPALTMIDRQGRASDLSDRWRKPVVLLIDGGSRSGKEVFAHGFRRAGLGPLVGQRTAGAVVGGSPFPLGDDLLVFLAVVDVTVDGERLEGLGVAPDIEVARPLPYSAGADPQLERALREAFAIAFRQQMDQARAASQGG